MQQDQEITTPECRSLGLDLSLTSTGVAFLGDGALDHYNLDPGKRRGCDRLAYLTTLVGGLMVLHKPDIVVVEDYAVSKSMKAHALGEWGGVVRMLLWAESACWYIVAPNTMKKFVLGSGGKGTSKSQIPMHLYRSWGLWVEQEDQADATGLAVMGAAKRGQLLGTLDKKRAEALEVMRPGETRARRRTRNMLRDGG